ncbi:dimethylarginine dimethylaminohydrolase family protein [Vibrio nitrifigilis]|uniref:arginine deiminase n=1 Tax=Vibrio nitrifigilis TaxID=2789781 RepID=A0ABS0GD34_9VIBR|nr:arginine deiminase family protein [Vibrio nitrifigilis]MBF9000331.1 amidinotransferase [Vibrio nitrifigilis]
MTTLFSHRNSDGNTSQLEHWGIRSETGTLKDVLVGPIDFYEWRSGNSTSRRHLGDGVQYDIDVAKAQYNEMLDVYQQADVQVHYLKANQHQPYNVFARDSSIMTPWGPIITQMFSPWRRSEWLTVTEFYLAQNIPIYDVVTAGSFEGGDFMLIEPGVALCGYSGERTSPAGIAQVKGWFEKEGWEFKDVKFDPHFLHLDVQCVMVAERLAAVCTAVVPDHLLQWLKAKHIDIIDIPYKEAMELGCNIVSLGDERVLIPAESYTLKEQCRARGLTVFDPDISMITKGGGGVHCMCQALKRID